jgi:hypothetical protein
MKYVFEASDISATGAGANGTIVTDNAEGEAEFHMIGIRQGTEGADGQPGTPTRYCLISLRDGSIQNPMSAEDLAKFLNDNNKRPVTERPPTIENYIRTARQADALAA